MKLFTLFSAVVVSCFALSGCGSGHDEMPLEGEGGVLRSPEPDRMPVDAFDEEDPMAKKNPDHPGSPSAPASGTPPESAIASATTPTIPSADVHLDYPAGQYESGKPGYIKSPYAPNAPGIPLSGLASGQEVVCPYSGKTFQVP